MIARFLQNIVVNDIEKNYELRKADGWGTMAPKECEGTYYEIIKE